MGTDKRERQKANRALKQQQVQQQASRRKTFRMIAIGVGAVAAVFLLAWIASIFVSDDDPAPAPVDTVVETPVDAPAETQPADTTPSTVTSSTEG